MENKEVQQIAKDTMQFIKETIQIDVNLLDIRRLCEDKMLQLGADSFWYWNIGAFIFSGKETTLSISGKRYQTANNKIQENDIITIDLSPQNGNIWGDYARTIIIEDGKVVEDIDTILNIEWKNGLLMENLLHEELIRYATIETTFEELFYHMNTFIKDKGFINLDFLKNLGHSIVTKSEDRIYIEKGNHKKLSDVVYFTFEPHISIPGSTYGYKKENIYYFNEGKLKAL